MMKKDKGTRKMVYFKSEKRYKLFKEICKELDTNISERLNDLIEEDIERMIACVEAYNKSKQKEIEKNEQ
jgi:formiminotetrahydrofolate cyclodeaminase